MLKVHEVVVRYTDEEGGHEITLNPDEMYSILISRGPVVNQIPTRDPDLADVFAKLDRDRRVVSFSVREMVEKGSLPRDIRVERWEGGNSVDASVCFHRWDCTWFCADP